METGSLVCAPLFPVELQWSLTQAPPSLIPLMGVCYMLQYMDKLALSQATLFNLTEDLVCFRPSCPSVFAKDLL